MTTVAAQLSSLRSPRALWSLAIVFFVVGDLLTTGIGLASGQIAEVGPIGAPVVNHYGFVGMVALKLVVVGLSYLAWRWISDPERIGIPLGLLFVGTLVTGWNALVVLTASGVC